MDLRDSVLAKSLKEISLRNCKVTSEGLKHLDWQKLENVDMNGIRFTGT